MHTYSVCLKAFIALQTVLYLLIHTYSVRTELIDMGHCHAPTDVKRLQCHDRLQLTRTDTEHCRVTIGLKLPPKLIVTLQQ